jgi:hypothetical protein
MTSCDSQLVNRPRDPPTFACIGLWAALLHQLDRSGYSRVSVCADLRFLRPRLGTVARNQGKQVRSEQPSIATPDEGGRLRRGQEVGKGGQASVQLWKSKKDGALIAVKFFKDPDPGCSDLFIEEENARGSRSSMSSEGTRVYSAAEAGTTSVCSDGVRGGWSIESFDSGWDGNGVDIDVDNQGNRVPSREEHCAPWHRTDEHSGHGVLDGEVGRLRISPLRGIGTDANESSCDCALLSTGAVEWRTGSEKSDVIPSHCSLSSWKPGCRFSVRRLR